MKQCHVTLYLSNSQYLFGQSGRSLGTSHTFVRTQPVSTSWDRATWAVLWRHSGNQVFSAEFLPFIILNKWLKDHNWSMYNIKISYERCSGQSHPINCFYFYTVTSTKILSRRTFFFFAAVATMATGIIWHFCQSGFQFSMSGRFY